MIVAGAGVKHVGLDADVGMIVYSALLMFALAVSAPWWLWRMATSGRYREGLAGRLGRVPTALQSAVAGKRVVWLHAVSVGEVLAAARLVAQLGAELAAELGAQLGDGWVVVVSTTTATGQKVARERFGAERVFYFPLDFAWAVRRYLRALKPELVVLMESEFWPRLLVECERVGAPVAVVNARVSDRSFPRYMRLRWLWRPLLAKVRVFLAQGQESAERLKLIGAQSVNVVGNLKFDLSDPRGSAIAERIRTIAAGRPIIVAGSTLGSKGAQALSEEEMLVKAWATSARRDYGALLVIAPRHPDRFNEVAAMAAEFVAVRASNLRVTLAEDGTGTEIVVLDTIGDLAAVYELANVAFIGGSLVPKGGHNPLEAARFGVPIVMGPSYENFREIVDGMRAVQAIRNVEQDELPGALTELLHEGKTMGERGREFYAAQAGATKRTVAALMELVR